MRKLYITSAELRQAVFKMAEVCQKLELTSRTLRYYESLGLLPGIRRTPGGKRIYSQRDIDLLQQIKAEQKKGQKLAEIVQKLPKENSKQIKIFVDSTLSLPSVAAAEIIPMQIKFGYYTYRDFLTLAPEKYSDFLKSKRTKAESAAPDKTEYLKIFQKAFADGYREIISLHADARIVGSYDQAVAAAKELRNLRISVIDTKLLALGFQKVWQELAKQKELTKKNIMDTINNVSRNFRELIILGQPEKFKEKTDNLAGMIFDFVPVIGHSAEKGFYPVDRCNNITEAIQRILPKQKKSVSIGYSNVDFWQKYAGHFQKLDLMNKIQYSSVYMANLGRDLIGLGM